ncbi:MAG: LacI family DNA-binding transcriptional regulator [Spirochaetaceae bacterium]|nr:LacI family DNA-binding transcriptional regulator [Spirochaetaceae bacterium]
MVEKIRRVSRADVAKMAGVSPTIVSYVVNDNRYVDADKKRRVHEAMNELGYRPNVIARALKGKHSHLILFIVDDLLSDHFGRINKQMNAWAIEHDYFICLCESRNDDDFISQIFQSYFDGVIIGSSTFKVEYLQKVINTNIPVVLFEMKNYSSLEGTFALINSGLYNGAITCCQELLNKKREHIIYVDSFIEAGRKANYCDDFRYSGFVDELKANNKYNDRSFRLITDCENEENLINKINALLDSGFAIDGVFGRTDYVAVQAMYALINRNFKIPYDCSVIGVNNSKSTNYTNPKLSSLDIDREGIGFSATNILSRMFSNEELLKEDLHIGLSTKLIIRESS